ncbi:MAG: S-methyl-5'-thioadenosine phosphorylase, partial [Candidatus Omnitrophota bacterium]
VALVTDYDVWKEDEDVSVEKVIANLTANSENAKEFIKKIVPEMQKARNCACASALENAIITASDAIPQQALDKVKLLVSKYIK